MLLIALCVEVTFAHAQELRSIESINQSCSPASRECWNWAVSHSFPC